MVVGTNSVPIRTPNFGCGEEVNFIQCKQLNCDTGGCGRGAWLWKNMFVWQPLSESSLQLDSTAPLHSSPFCLLCSSDIFGVSVPVEKQSWGKGKWAPGTRGELTFMEKSLSLVPDWSVSYK